MTEPQTGPVKKGSLARKAAMTRLMEKYGEEFAAMLAEERKARGLFPKVKGVTTKDLREQLEAAEAEIARLRAQYGHSA